MLRKGIYKHYKSDDQYEALGVAIYENTGEDVVVYQAQYGDKKMFVRPLSQFEEMVEWNGEQVPRFTFIRESLVK